MDSSEPDLAERSDRAVNELDIDFSRVTATGWLVNLLRLTAGGTAGRIAWQAMPHENGRHNAPSLVVGITLIAVTAATFLFL